MVTSPEELIKVTIPTYANKLCSIKKATALNTCVQVLKAAITQYN